MPETIRRSLVFARAVGVAIASAVLCGGLAAAQATAVPQRATKAHAGRPSGAHPDLQGVWGVATVTPLQRQKEFADWPEWTAAERAKLEEQAIRDQFVDQA